MEHFFSKIHDEGIVIKKKVLIIVVIYDNSKRRGLSG